MISVVTPVYKSEEIIPELHRRLTTVLKSITNDYEIVMVNDCSPGKDWDVIRQIAEEDAKVKGISLSRNFGQHYALTAGLDLTSGDWIVVMDCDLQDIPEGIPALYKKANEGYEVVWARRKSRKDKFFKRLSSRFFFKIFDFLSGLTSDHSIANFSIIKKEVVESFRKFREHNRSYNLFIRWSGFNQAIIDIDHSTRFEGKSTYTFKKLINLALDTIIAHSNKPLRLSINLGFLMSFGSILYSMFLIIRYLTHRIGVEGWTSVIVSLWFIGGLIFANLGIIGLYLGKIFDEVKNRPLYLIKETINI